MSFLGFCKCSIISQVVPPLSEKILFCKMTFYLSSMQQYFLGVIWHCRETTRCRALQLMRQQCLIMPKTRSVATTSDTMRGFLRNKLPRDHHTCYLEARLEPITRKVSVSRKSASGRGVLPATRQMTVAANTTALVEKPTLCTSNTQNEVMCKALPIFFNQCHH